MSGISGVSGGGGEDPLLSMLEELEHRGPDQRMILPGEQVALGIDGLVVTDRDRAAGPSAKDGNMQAVVDGRIYNRQELLPGAADMTEAELVLALYATYGPSFVQKTQGMFALALREGPHLMVARDPLGIKPLYYGEDDGLFYFASEIKGLAGVDCDIHEFPPGWSYHTAHGWMPFHNPPEADWTGVDPEKAVRELRRQLDHTVERYLQADVPVGFFLSGGLDSSAVAALAAQHTDNLVTFAVGTEQSHDLEQARYVAEHLGTEHHEVVYDQDVVKEVLDDVIYHLESFDEAFVRGSVPNYLVSRRASEEGIKVVFSGEGADELFAGYGYLKSLASRDQVQAELDKLVQGLHNTGLQRVDRMTAAHSMECRVPFLDQAVATLAHRMPLEWKLRPEKDDEPMEKWVLRRSVDDLLPSDIVWRRKEQFSEGSGSADILEEACRDLARENAVELEPDAEGVPLRSAEERYYYQRFHEMYPQEDVLETVGRWLQSL